MTNEGYIVTETIEGAHPKLTDYPLLQNDLLVKDSDGSYAKECPGLAVLGFRLTSEQEATLKKVSYVLRGLDYKVIEDRVAEARLLADKETWDAVEKASQSTVRLPRRRLDKDLT